MIAILEDSGYMSRVTYIMNEKMKKLGLPGKGIIPLLLGFGCSVPAVMSTRILENYKDRLKIILIIPFMSCYAKIPIYILISQTFFGKYSSITSFFMYVVRNFTSFSNFNFFKVYIENKNR
ncbi:Ferrous iron transport protein B [compost metagenome]